MIPTEYRLEHVVAGLIERLDGARRSFDDQGALREGFRRIADEQLDAVTSDASDLRFVAAPEAHAAFLRREVHQTFLPRFVRDAHAMNVAERGGFGFGPLAAPVGRIVLVLGAAALGWLLLTRGGASPLPRLLLVADLAVPFLPDLAAALSVRRYRAAIAATLADLARIQDQVAAWAPAPALEAEAPHASRPDGAGRRGSPPAGVSDGS